MDPSNPFFPFAAFNPGSPYAGLYNSHEQAKSQAIQNQSQQAQFAYYAQQANIKPDSTIYNNALRNVLLASIDAQKIHDPRDETMKLWDDDFERVENGSN